MGKLSLKTWFEIHKWSSLVCTVFLLLLCLTGLPLIFSHEIDHWLDDAKPYAEAAPGTPRASLDAMVAESKRLYPDDAVEFVFIDDDDPQVVIGLNPELGNQDRAHRLRFDAHTGELLKRFPPAEQEGHGFMEIMLHLHVDMFAGLAGELFLGFMGLLFCIAVVSGVVLYGPYMKKIPFGSVRAERSARIKWLDLHNLLGVATLAWAFVVGFTGVINELSTPMFKYWQGTAMQTLLAPYQGKSTPQSAELSSVDAAYAAAQKAQPGMKVNVVTFPGNPFGSPYHYFVWLNGDTALTSRLFSPVLVDARTGAVDTQLEMPWYLRALEVSRPLHFGDYAGMPLKIIWAVLDVITIIVLATGVYLWIARRKSAAARIAELEARHKAWAREAKA
ncbi:PepSY-associated TM helix domain-containing protein [Bordetella genomosp. 11]|uniref:Peptidase n=1 Tax=Bordetella genomosp. 11 TaxID=1416808 RepID=A0A261UN10_9BORD|nr:PepSY-associated TM helix domain-containing protein [Bordetella genomosp. 11]OZI62670.1 hypothetical protein CAL28_26360 [Bordetella genomosp. 11]